MGTDCSQQSEHPGRKDIRSHLGWDFKDLKKLLPLLKNCPIL
jgi:hypothetical protein